MNLLVVGNGQGSWAMRGVQLGDRLGARVKTAPTAEDWAWADLAVLVKNWGARYAREAQQAGVPVVWDAVDFWRQPFDHKVDAAGAKALLAQKIREVAPVLTIGATKAMAEACGGAYLPHHTWKGLEPQAPRPEARLMAYQGNPLYLGRWHAILRAACFRQGWEFVVNPPELWHADVVVALRDGDWDGWICREWKSGVKLGNAIAAGRPVLCNPSAAFRELSPIGLCVDGVPSGDVVEEAIQAFADKDYRWWAYDMAQRKAPALRLPAVADRYRAILAEFTKTRATA